MVKAEDRVNDWFAQTKCFFSDEEFKIIKESYSFIKPLVTEDMYSEVANECMTSMLVRRKEGMEISFDVITKDAITNLGLGNEDTTAVVPLRQLNGFDEILDLDDSNRREAISAVYEDLKSSNDTKNAIFLDVLSGETTLLVAKKYRLTEKEVRDIYTERLGYVKSILIIDHDVLIKDVESREPFKSNVKMLTDNK